MIGQILSSVTELATPVAITPIFINAFVVSGWLCELGWGTDWPHPKFDGPMPDDTDMLDQFIDWVPNAQLRHKIMVENPERFYQFSPLKGM